MPFKPASSEASVPEGPLALFDDLPRMPGSVPELWRQQGEILRQYADLFAKKADVAVELPTGTGKTIVGLLICDWRRRQHLSPVLYACPTQQLAHQVSAVASREGIPVVTLVGSHTRWPRAELSRYDAAQAIAVTTYSAIFNAAPKVGQPGSIVFDDAHAGEQYVADAWSVHIERAHHRSAYDAVLRAVRPGLSGMYVQALSNDTPDVRARLDVRLVVPLRRSGMAGTLDEALQTLPHGSSPWWSWNSIRGGLESCLVYVSWHEILIRPFIPPTNGNEPFAGADQRVYLSATLGHAGELERSFGRPSIDRLPLPDGRSPRSGRRYFIFSDLADGDPHDLTTAVVSKAGKALVLATSTRDARELAEDLNVEGWPILGKDDIETSLSPFTAQPRAILALAGRYDGIDLPDEACRLVCLQGLPDWAHLQERFLGSNLRAKVALEERIRTRVVQGAGRATRNPSDHAIVVVRGHGLTRYLASPIVRRTFDADLQAEVDFGLTNSRDMATEDLLENVDIFLEQGESWRDEAEPHISEARRRSDREDAPGSGALQSSAGHEVAAWAHAFRGDYAGARDEAQRAAEALAGDDEVRSYRALWLYLAAVWASSVGEPGGEKTAAGLLKAAHDAARGTTWLRETDAGVVRILDEDADDTPAVRALARRLESKVKQARIDEGFASIHEGLLSVEHTKSEPAITELGTLLGAEAFKPAGQGRADSAWCWEERVWLLFEAKSEQKPEGEVALRDVRQANTQLRQLESDRGVGAPALSAVALVSPRRQVADQAVTAATAEVFLVHPDQLREIASDAEEAWRALFLTYRGHSGSDLETLVRRALAEHQVLPTQVLERLTWNPLRR